MANIKKQTDGDNAFWEEFHRLEYQSAQSAWERVGEQEERPVSITIKDQQSGEEWEMEGVMTMEKKKGYSD